MARRVRSDLSYFNLDCDIFSTKSGLKPLIDRYQADGLAVYIHILCDVYGTGYYFKPDNYEDYLYALAKDIGISVDKVQLILTFMADRTLLDAFSLNKNTVFTSHGIQKRYAEAMKGRKRSIAEIKGEHWLLTEVEEAEIETFYKSRAFENKSEINDDKSEKMDDKSKIYDITEQNRNKQKEKEQKEEFKVSKQVSNKKEKIQSYDEIFEDFSVTGRYKEVVLEFIRYLKTSYGIVVLNDRLNDLLAKLDLKYGKDDLPKRKEIRRAIVNGYKRLECEEVT